jgi:hypothetical protein
MMRAASRSTCGRGGLLRPVALAMTMIMALVSMPVGGARAALIGTDQIIGEAAAASDRDRVAAFLEREDVRSQLVMLGIDPAEAAARVASLSDEEVDQISGHLGQLPSGEGAIGAIVGAAVLIFVVLLITDLLGLTDVFPFVRR